MAELMFDLGQRAYGKGSYGRAIEFLEGALTIIPRSTLLGGEVSFELRRITKTAIPHLMFLYFSSFFSFFVFADTNMACYGL